MKKTNVKKDPLLSALMNGKWMVLSLLVFTVLYLITSTRILNFPKLLVWINLIVLTLAITVLFLVRYKKYKLFYKRKVKDKFNIFAFIIMVLFYGFLIQFFLRIPANLVIANAASGSETEYYNCEIKSVNTIGYDKISFIFLNDRYSRFYIAGHNSKELKRDYWVRLEVKKSILDAYYITKFELVKK